MKYLFLVLICTTGFVSMAQEDLVPAGPQQQAIILINGTAHLGDGTVIENAAIGFEDGEITLVANSASIEVDTGKARMIDATGQHIYPGLIAPNTLLGLAEIDQVRATRDFDETGKLNPNVRTLIAYNTDSDILPTIRHNGILLAESKPWGGRISGTSSIMKMDGWNWEDAVYQPDVGIHINWPEKYKRKSKYELEENDDWHMEIRELRSFMDDARSYCRSEDAEKNLKLEAMCPVLDSTRKAFIHVNKAHDMMRAIDFITTYHLDGVLVGAADVWRMRDEVKKSGIPVVLGEVHRLPATTNSDIHQPYHTPALLQQDSILFCLSMKYTWRQRNLPFQAGTAAAYGLTKEEALSAITLNVANIYGLDDRTGSLEVGKDANIIVVSGDLLDMRSSRVSQAFIQGREINLDNKQKRLYRKFSQKYNLEIEE